MSQFDGRRLSQGQVPKSPGAGIRGTNVRPEDTAYLQPTKDTAYLQPTPGYSSSSAASSGSVGARTINEYDSGVADIDGVNISERPADNYIQAQRSSYPVNPGQGPGWGKTPPPGTAVNPLPTVSQSQPQQGIMKRPESLARGHEYEELPSARYQNPTEYSYTDMESNVSQPRTPGPERLVSANGSNSTQSGASGDSRDLYFDTNHNDRPPSAYRKRENPLYDSADHVRQPSLQEKSKSSICSCPNVILIFFSLVAVCAFVLAALAISGIGASLKREAALVTPSSHLQKAIARIEALEKQYTELLEKYDELYQTVGDPTPNATYPISTNGSGYANTIHHLIENDKILAHNISGLNSQVSAIGNASWVNTESITMVKTDLITQKEEIVETLSAQAKLNKSVNSLNTRTSDIEKKTNQVDLEEIQRLKINVTVQSAKIRQLEEKIEVYRTTMNNDIIQFKQNITVRVDTISRTPGPPGVGNLSACEYKQITVGGSSDIPQSTTQYIPGTDADAKAWVITGVECAVMGGTFANVETKDNWGGQQFRCLCSGKTAQNRYCYMHYWRCPRLS